MILQDGSAHKYTYGVKGDSGTRFCFLCRNAVASGSLVAKHSSDDILVTSIADVDQLRFATDEDIRSACDRLKEAKANMSATNFKLYEQVVGINLNEAGLLFDEALVDIVRPCSQFCHDWQHCLFVSGVFHTTLYLLLIDAAMGMKDMYKMSRPYQYQLHAERLLKSISKRICFINVEVKSVQQ